MHLGTVAVLGAGTMAAAVLGGLAESADISVDEIRTTNRTQQAAARWSGRPGVRAFALSDSPDANRQAVTDADLILLGVKPAGVLTLLEEIADRVEPSALVVSLAAGITLEAMAARLPPGVTIVRTAANTPSLVRAGVTGLASTSADADQRDLINRLFAVLGEVLWVDEDELHLVAAVSGSGPAYLYFMLEQFARAAVEHGCEPDLAARLTEATFVGAAELLRTTGLSPTELRRQVTSPQGATERAIAVLDQARLNEAFAAAMAAAMARTREMGAGS